MSYLTEQFVVAQTELRQREAREARRSRQYATARRLSRRAERAAAQARLAVARSL